MFIHRIFKLPHGPVALDVKPWRRRFASDDICKILKNQNCTQFYISYLDLLLYEWW
jgi:hypothetical protein